MLLGIKKKTKTADQFSIRDYYNKRNKVVIIRETRGIGDILTARMLFSNFKKLMPDLHLTFACQRDYVELLQGHPDLDDVISLDKLNKDNYAASYNISECCVYYESREMERNTKHRAEIWAEHCGLSLIDHNMHLPFISNEKIMDGYLAVKQLRNLSMMKDNKNGPSVLFCPLAFEALRTLLPDQMYDTLQALRKRGLFVFSTHDKKLDVFSEMGIPVLTGQTFADWMSYIHAADCIVSVDTATFHYAGAIAKPLTGIFTHVDGKLRGKFYDFILVQKHRDNGNWPCGPCYNYLYCTHEKCTNPRSPLGLRPCLTELKIEEIEEGIDKMLAKWNI